MLLSQIPFRAALVNGDGQSVVTREKSYVWSESLSNMRKAAALFSHLEVSSERRIAIFANNSPEYIELLFAAPMSGGALLPLNTRLAPQEIHFMVDEARPKVFVFDRSGAEIAASLQDAGYGIEIFVALYEDAPAWARSYHSLLEKEPEMDPAPVELEQDWAIVFTGGTTGRPKAARISYRAMQHNVYSILADMDWGEGHRLLQSTPLFHLAGLGANYYSAARAGAQILMSPSFSASEALGLIEKYKCTAASLVPTTVKMILNHDKFEEYDLSSWTHLGYGSSPIEPVVLKRLFAKIPELKLNQFYGQTESCGGIATLRPDDHLNTEASHRLASAGLPVFDVRVKIVDIDTKEEVPRGVRGEIVAKTEGVFSGYLGNEKLSGETVRNGWLYTGDIGILDDDGYLFVVDRLKDMIVSGGENVSSTEVEAVLLEHEAVAMAAVIGCKDEKWGERVHAIVTLRDGNELDEEALIEHCRKHIAAYKCPKSVTIRQEPMPISGPGKILKSELRKEYS